MADNSYGEKVQMIRYPLLLDLLKTCFEARLQLQYN